MVVAANCHYYIALAMLPTTPSDGDWTPKRCCMDFG